MRAGPQAVLDVAPQGEVRKERAVLEHHADTTALRRKVDVPFGVDQRAAGVLDARLVGSQQAGDGAQHRCLARSGRTDEGQGLAPDADAHVELDATQAMPHANGQQVVGCGPAHHSRHPRIILVVMRTAKLTATSRADMARHT